MLKLIKFSTLILCFIFSLTSSVFAGTMNYRGPDLSGEKINNIKNKLD